MLNGGFITLLLLALATILVVAAVIDTRTFTISNRITAGVALGAPVYWLAVGVDPFPGMAIQLAAGAIVFAVLAVAFYTGMMGGGDVKLAAALALWFTPANTIKFLTLMAIAGGVLTVVMIVWHRAKNGAGRPKIPYGVAIAAGALFVLAPILTQRFLNQFV